ncbi:unnamed protein product, partial [Didymodactylos carnosus]
ERPFSIVQRNYTQIYEGTNITLPELTISLWSGLALKCITVIQIVTCTLSLPDKFKNSIEGLAGNFDDNATNDLVNRVTNVTVFNLANDSQVYDACVSWATINSAPSAKVIYYYNFLSWFNNTNTTNITQSFDLNLNPSTVYSQCSNQQLCVHDYVISLNYFTSKALQTAVETYKSAIVILAQDPPKIIVPSLIQTYIPSKSLNSSYAFNITITRPELINNVTYLLLPVNQTFNALISANNISTYTIVISAVNFTEEMNVTVDVYYNGTQTVVQTLDINMCLCNDFITSCDWDHTVTLGPHYQIANCSCSANYTGRYCDVLFNPCNVSGVCKQNFQNDTSCGISQNASQPYVCYGYCLDGFESLDNYTCSDIDECLTTNVCTNGDCINLYGSYTCQCFAGYHLVNRSCESIHQCTEPNADGTWPIRCPYNGTICIETTSGNYSCDCYSPYFNNISGVCLHWCSISCPGFCEINPLDGNQSYFCNCGRIPGYDISDDGRSCIRMK